MTSIHFTLWMCCVVNFVISTYGADDAPVVQIAQGVLRGQYLVSRKGRQFSSFRGIPYAKPPIGELRFEPPQPPESWDGVLNATEVPNFCPQNNRLPVGPDNIIGNEDCLYLNLYTPQTAQCNKTLLPVLIYIQGGAWRSGNISYYNPRNLLDKDIVLVHPSYRLGALGFLTTGDEIVPGNNGLKDQVLAIKWVKENIAQFGGNPEEITLAGQDVGAISSLYHRLSPLSKDLIKGAIIHSPILVYGLSPNNQTLRNSIQLAQSLNCSTETSEEMVSCLRTINATDITVALGQFAQWTTEPVGPFKPVIEPNIEGAFLPENPLDIIKSGKAANIPVIVGIMTEEGAVKSAKIFGNSTLLVEYNEDFNPIVPLTIEYYDTAANVDLVTQQIRDYYFGDGEIDQSSRSNGTNLYTDGMFVTPIHHLVELLINYTTQPVYYNVFGYRSGVSFSQIYGDPVQNYGVCDTDEALYLYGFHTTFPDYQLNVTDERVTDIFIDLWVNFITTGDPTPEPTSLIPTKWEPVQSENLEFYLIRNDTDIRMSEKLYWERYEFWKTLPLGIWI